MNISLDRIEALLIVVLVTFGVTLSSMLWGAESGPYLVAVLGAGLLSTIRLVRSSRSGSIFLASLTGILLLTVWLIQGLIFQDGSFNFEIKNSFLNLIAVQLIIIIGACLQTVAKPSLEQAFFIAWIGHFFVMIYGIVWGGLSFEQIGSVRFSGAGFREVIWAEVALGALALAVLCNRLYPIVITAPFSGFLIAASQMRTVGIAATIGVLLFLYYRASIHWSRKNKIVLTSAMIVPIFAFFTIQADQILSAISTVLLLDDMHRGIASGFSGRFDNIIAGLELFARSPIVGVGSLQPDAAYVHNGYIKVLAQYGIFGAFWIYFVILSCWRAWVRRDIALLTVIIMLLLYYMGQPRHLSFQVFPLAGVIAVFLANAKPTQKELG